LPDFERGGVTVFAISYDPVDVLAGFTTKYGIGYDLLSDQGSRVIRDLGLLNGHLAQQHAHYGIQTRPQQEGVAYPGIFVLDEHGVVVEKQFEQSYRVRPSAASVAEEVFHAPSTVPGARAEATANGVQVAAWLGSRTYRPYQKLWLNVAIQLAPGFHVYAPPVPADYTPVTIEIEAPEPHDVGPPRLPPAHPFLVEGLDEEFQVYDGTVTVGLPLTFFSNLGEIPVVVRVRYQACSETVCYPPEEVSLRLALSGLENLRD
jgi:peroxiredoxin